MVYGNKKRRDFEYPVDVCSLTRALYPGFNNRFYLQSTAYLICSPGALRWRPVVSPNTCVCHQLVLLRIASLLVEWRNDSGSASKLPLKNDITADVHRSVLSATSQITITATSTLHRKSKGGSQRYRNTFCNNRRSESVPKTEQKRKAQN